MKTNFFSLLNGLLGNNSAVTIHVKRNIDILTVSVSSTIGDKGISPVVLTGSMADMDDGFISALAPVQSKINGLVVSTAELEAELSALEAENTKKKETKKKKDLTEHNEVLSDAAIKPAKKLSLSDLTKQATELMQALKHDEALVLLKQAIDLKPGNASVKQSIETCEKWIARKKAMEAPEGEKQMPQEMVSIQPDQIEEPSFEEESPFVDEAPVADEPKQSEDDFTLF